MLYIVSTPLGNISDIIPRALEVLKNSDYILCEDTRITLKLLSYYGINKKILRYNEHSEKSLREIYSILKTSKNVCLLSDAGTPCISDPGWKIVKYARENNISVEVIGGSSALIYALAGSGFDASRFVFLGFLPRSETKMKKILTIALSNFLPVVIYESPNRIIELLEFVLKNFGDIKCVVARELTKIYEEWIYGKVSEVIEKLKFKLDIKGEITVVLSSYRDVIKISSIGFVCTGNTCRSVMAEMYTKKIILERNINIQVSSSGLYVNDNDFISENLKKVLARENIVLNHTPRQIDRGFIENNDIILTMTREHKKKLIGLFPEYDNKIFTLSEYTEIGGDIYDPYGKDYMFYEVIFNQIKKAVIRLVEKISEINK